MNFRLISFAAALLLGIISVKAQTFSIGLETGIASSNNSYEQITDLSNRRNTYFSGLNVSYQFNSKFAFASGFQYLKQGSRSPPPQCYVYEDGENHYVTRKIDYLAVPLTFNAAFGPEKRFLAIFGIYGAYNIKAIQDYDEPDWGCKIGIIDDVSPWTEKFSFGGIMGAGYRIYSNERFEFNAMAKYYQGISNTSPKIQYIPRSQNRYASALFTVSLNYKIPVRVSKKATIDTSEEF